MKRAEMVCIPYTSVPGMDTKSREFVKAAEVDKARFGFIGAKRARTEPPYISGLGDANLRGPGMSVS